MSQSAPMFGNWTVVVHAVKPFSIHGDLYFELTISRVDEPGNAMLAVRLAQHAVRATPTVGDRMTLTFLMGQVTGATVEK
jgi:hypothetical protein